jgi:hypothetical protein
MRKQIIIVRHHCHEFANKLWSDMAVYAYALMVDARIWDLARFETGPFALLHTLLARLLKHGAAPVQYTTLPPSVPLQGKYAERNIVYFFGWLFRNPEGLIRYRTELIQKFGPTAREEARIKKQLAALPAGRIIIGVHMRLTPFPYFTAGEFLIPPTRVRDIVHEYLREQGLTQDKVALVLVADTSVPSVFGDFVTLGVRGNARANFLLLSKCSAIIGTNTTFSNLAAWFGNVPHVVTTEHPIDWAYYSGKQHYFDNRYATFALGVSGQG